MINLIEITDGLHRWFPWTHKSLKTNGTVKLNVKNTGKSEPCQAVANRKRVSTTPYSWNVFYMTKPVKKRLAYIWQNKADLWDLIAATGRVILLKLDSNSRFISPGDLKIYWMTSKHNRAPLLSYIKLCASFQIQQWIQTGATARKLSVRVKIDDFCCPAWPWNLTNDLEK